MKYQTTKKAIINQYSKIIKIGYGDAQYLLRRQVPEAYTAGIYGWSSDIYNINGIIICTGYRPFGNITPSCNTTNTYNEQARAILNNYDMSHEDKRKRVNTILEQFIQEVTK